MDPNYELLHKLGQGGYGSVYKAIEKFSKQEVAIKIVKVRESSGLFLSFCRELDILYKARHMNIISVLDVFKSGEPPEYCTVLELCSYDLTSLLRNPQIKFSPGEKKDMLQQLFNGINYVHRLNFFHRDLKPSNILVTHTGVMKLADFGLAKSFSETDKCHSPNMVTLWYRSPELLLGAKEYTTAVDLWSLGCIMTEFWTGGPMMKGTTEQAQLNLITSFCGPISPDTWPSVVDLPVYKIVTLVNHKPRMIQHYFQSMMPEPHALDLLDALLVLDPCRRLNAKEALDHPYFSSQPLPESIQYTLTNLENSPSGSVDSSSNGIVDISP